MVLWAVNNTNCCARGPLPRRGTPTVGENAPRVQFARCQCGTRTEKSGSSSVVESFRKDHREWVCVRFWLKVFGLIFYEKIENFCPGGRPGPIKPLNQDIWNSCSRLSVSLQAELTREGFSSRAAPLWNCWRKILVEPREKKEKYPGVCVFEGANQSHETVARRRPKSSPKKLLLGHVRNGKPNQLSDDDDDDEFQVLAASMYRVALC